MIFNIYKKNNVVANWINHKVDNPVFHFFISIDADINEDLNNIWLKLVIPFNVDKLNSKWNKLETCCSINDIEFLNTEEMIIPMTNSTIVYIKLLGSIYKKNDIYVLRITPNKYLKSPGFSDVLEIYFVSDNNDKSIVYAYNKSFFKFYMHKQPSYNLILKDITSDQNKYINGKTITSKISIINNTKNIGRIVINTIGGYEFLTEHECKIENFSFKHTCNFWNEAGFENKNKYLELILEDIDFPLSEIIISYKLKTPDYFNQHSLKIFLLAKKAPIIYVLKSYENIFETKNNLFDESYPKLYYSFNIDAADNSIKNEVGLYSMGNGYNWVYNSLLFKIRTNKIFIDSSKIIKTKIEFFLGDTNAIVPLGYIFNNFNKLTNKEIITSFNNGILTFENILINNNTEYSIGLKVGYKNEKSLPNDWEKGLGLIKYYINDMIILKDIAKYKTNFNKIYKNYSLILPDNQLSKSSNNRLQRTYSAFRSGDLTTLINVSNYRSSSTLNGLRKGNNLGFWFTSSIGTNFLYYNNINEFTNYHNSNRTFVDVYTDKSITTSSNNFSDLNSAANCRFFSSSYNVWSDQITKTQADLTLPVVINTHPDNYNFIGGCSVTKPDNKYTKLRMRFTNKYFVDTNNIGNFIIGAKFPFVNNNKINQALPIEGSIFIWKNIDITKFSNLYPNDKDYSILDSYVLFHLFGDHENTLNDVNTDAEISVLDNMYVLSNNDSNIQTSNINFNLLYSWIINSLTVPNYDLSGNSINEWPNVIHLSGTIGNIDDTTKNLLIFFDFLEPIEIDEVTQKIECKGNNLKILKCTKIIGIKDIPTLNFKKAVQLVSGTISTEDIFPINSRVSYGINIEFENSPKNKEFSIAFPFKNIFGTNVNNIVKLNSGIVSASPSFIVINNEGEVTDYIDYGCGADYVLNPIEPSRVITNYLSKEIQPINIKNLDDTTANNNPSNSVWVSKIGTSNPIIGTLSNLNLKVNCDTGCLIPPAALRNFAGALFCVKNKFYEDKSFEVNNNITDIKGKCDYFGYKINGKIKYCLHCPGVNNVTSPNLDANALNFNIINFRIPHDIGTKWSLDAISVLGKPNLSNFMKPNSLNFEFGSNLINPLEQNINLNQEFDSLVLTFSINIKTNIPKNGIIFFGYTSGCEPLLKFNGTNLNQICQIVLNKISYKCNFNIITGGVQINLLENWPPGDLIIKIWGVSTGKSNISYTCNLKIESYLTNKKSPILKLDESTNFISLNFTEKITSGNLKLKNINWNQMQKSLNSILNIELDLDNRTFYRNDLIVLNLGPVKYKTNKRPVACSIWKKENNISKLSSIFKECNVDNLSDIRIKPLEDIIFKNFTLSFDNIENPIINVPSINSNYYINDGFFSFESNKLNWENLENNSKFINEPVFYYNKTQSGFWGEYHLIINSDIDLLLDDILYLTFPLDFNPNLTSSKIFAYIKYNNILKPIKVWFFSKRSIALLGWNINIIAKTKIEFIIDGILNPPEINSSLQIIIGKENLLKSIKKWSKIFIKIDNSIKDIGLIFIKKLTFDNLFLRQRTKITINFFLFKKILKNEKILIYFHYLNNELLKKLKPICFLTNLIEYKQNIDKCIFNGNKIEALALNDLNINIEYTLEITDIPNPDYYDNSSKNIEIWVVDKDNKYISLNSNELLINYKNINFKKQTNVSFLEFQGNSELLKIPRGFYNIKNIVVERNRSFEDVVTFKILNTFQGEIVSKPINFLEINNFSSNIGSISTKFIIGASNLAALTQYSVEISKKEQQGNRYSNLPFLNLLVTQDKISLKGKNNINIYKGYKSLPIEITPSLIPVDPIYIDLLYPNGAIPEIIINEYVRQVIISSEKPNIFLIFRAEKNLIPQNVKLQIKPSIEGVLINDFILSLNILEKTLYEQIDFNFEIIKNNNFGVELQLNTNQELFILYYIMPSFNFIEKSYEEVLKNISSGIKKSGKINYGYQSIERNTKININNLNEETLYRIKFYFESPQGNGWGFKYLNFKTSSRSLKKGIIILEFENELDFEERKKLLCIISTRFKLNPKVIWTDDGINCDTELITGYIKTYLISYYSKTNNNNLKIFDKNKNNSSNSIYDNLYNIINSISSNSNSITEVSTNQSIIKKYNLKKTMFLKIYNSKEENKLNYTYDRLKIIINRPNSKSLFNFYFNGIANLIEISDYKEFKYEIFNENLNNKLNVLNKNSTIFLNDFNFEIKEYERINCLILAIDKNKLSNNLNVSGSSKLQNVSSSTITSPNTSTTSINSSLTSSTSSSSNEVTFVPKNLNFTYNLDPNYDFDVLKYDNYYFSLLKKEDKKLELKNFKLSENINYKIFVIFYSDSRQYSIYNKIKIFDLLIPKNTYILRFLLSLIFIYN